MIPPVFGRRTLTPKTTDPSGPVSKETLSFRFENLSRTRTLLCLRDVEFHDDRSVGLLREPFVIIRYFE